MDTTELRRRKDKAPYDKSYEYNYYLYDNLPYTMDTNLLNADTHILLSEYLIKHNHYKMSETSFCIQSDKLTDK